MARRRMVNHVVVGHGAFLLGFVTHACAEVVYFRASVGYFIGGRKVIIDTRAAGFNPPAGSLPAGLVA